MLDATRDQLDRKLGHGQALARQATSKEPTSLEDRTDAGAQLAEHLEAHRGQDVLFLGIPRGGVPPRHTVPATPCASRGAAQTSPATPLAVERTP